MPKDTRFVSFDPASLRNLGWSIVTYTENDQGKFQTMKCACGTFTLKKAELVQRHLVLWTTFVLVDAFLERSKPDLVIIEQTSSFRGSFVTGQISQCMGVLMAACGKHEVQTAFVYPSSVKKKVTGNGRATKTIMKKNVTSIMADLTGETLKFDSEHSVDATANIICWLIQQGAIEVETDG